MEGIRNNPETRGKPCQYEIETGRIFKVDSKARHLRDCIKNFTKNEVLALLEYYVDMEKFKTENVERVLIYSLSY